MNATAARPTAVIVGVGPGLGLSMAHRIGREGYHVVLISRSADRHQDYLSTLAAQGITGTALAADVRDRSQLITALDQAAAVDGAVDLLYYGPGAVDPSVRPETITETNVENARSALEWVYPAVDAVQTVLPGMIERGRGGLIFAGGLSGARPMPMLGGLALSSAALRTYALTLNAALTEQGVFAGILTIGGLVDRGDIHQMITQSPESFGPVIPESILNPDEIAEEAWQLFTRRDQAELIFSTFPEAA